MLNLSFEFLGEPTTAWRTGEPRSGFRVGEPTVTWVAGAAYLASRVGEPTTTFEAADVIGAAHGR